MRQGKEIHSCFKPALSPVPLMSAASPLGSVKVTEAPGMFRS